MNLLLDTQAFLWYVAANPRLSNDAREAISDPSVDVFVSVVSIWEAVIKQQLGKLRLPMQAAGYLITQRTVHRFEALAVTEASMSFLEQLPLLHRDPFDRLLVAQSKCHSLRLVTSDPEILAYDVDTLAAE